MRILIVEDNSGDITLLREALREVNSLASVTVASDGDQCLELLLGESALETEHYPDLIFLDLSLPTISGYEVLRRLKGDARTRHIPVIILSSAHSSEEVERAYGGYANAFVRKPQTLQDLLSTARGLKSFWMDTARLATTLARDSREGRAQPKP